MCIACQLSIPCIYSRAYVQYNITPNTTIKALKFTTHGKEAIEKLKKNDQPVYSKACHWPSTLLYTWEQCPIKNLSTLSCNVLSQDKIKAEKFKGLHQYSMLFGTLEANKFANHNGQGTLLSVSLLTSLHVTRSPRPFGIMETGSHCGLLDQVSIQSRIQHVITHNQILSSQQLQEHQPSESN